MILMLFLRMNWLATYHASMDCFTKEIIFRILGEMQFHYRGVDNSCIGLVSAIKVRKMLMKGCAGFMACVIVDKDSEVSLRDIPMVREFPDVFPEDLSGLPPDREIEFAIDLLPGTAPISKAPYRMAPTELKELKVQLQDLLEKGFIRPSVSP